MVDLLTFTAMSAKAMLIGASLGSFKSELSAETTPVTSAHCVICFGYGVMIDGFCFLYFGVGEGACSPRHVRIFP